MMLTASQRACLEDIVRSVDADFSLEAATLDEHQTLEVVLCRDLVCFRPLRITAQKIDILAALEGQMEARQALLEHLQTVLSALG